jgi:TRAP-type C4-dicarboxylate transport system permease small subunit
MDSSPIGRFVHALARYVALAGGAVLVAMIAVTVVSIIGRILIPLNALVGTDFSPIPGDYEIVEAGMAFAIFAFLPWCHLTRGHAVVAIVTDRLPVRYNAIAELVIDILFLVIAVLITWRHWAGLIDKMGYNETTFILRLPLWWWYAGGMVGAVTFILVAAYCTVRSAGNAFSREPQMPKGEIAE